MTKEEIAVLVLAGWEACDSCHRLHHPDDLYRSISGGLWTTASNISGRRRKCYTCFYQIGRLPAECTRCPHTTMELAKLPRTASKLPAGL